MTLRAVAFESRITIPREQGVLDAARNSLESQAAALVRLAARLDDEFGKALNLLVGCHGRVIVSGMGKSGLIGRKIAATLSCCGTPSFFLHPGEAAHGDLGMVTPSDVLLLVSNSGESSELVGLLPSFLELGVPMVALVGDPSSTLARASNAVLDASVERETCPHNLVPTTSALAALAMGDALATAAMRMRGLTAGDVGRLHPAGNLGRRLTTRVRDVMLSRRLPIVTPERKVSEALFTMTRGRCGLAVVVDEAGEPVGIITDGDLRRALQQRPGLLDLPVSEIMTAQPVTIHQDATLHEAEERMHRLRLKALVVIDRKHRVAGVIEIFNDR